MDIAGLDVEVPAPREFDIVDGTGWVTQRRKGVVEAARLYAFLNDSRVVIIDVAAGAPVSASVRGQIEDAARELAD